jgi:hypothetical protein
MCTQRLRLRCVLILFCLRHSLCACSNHMASARSRTPPPSIDGFFRDGLRRLKPPSQVPRERQSAVFKRVVAEWKEDRSPGRRTPAVPSVACTITAPQSARSVSPQTVRSVTPSAAHRPPPVEPMSVASARRFDPAQKSVHSNETYFTGDTVQEHIAHAGNSGAMMRSSVPRLFQMVGILKHGAEPPEKVIGLAKEQLKKPNSGVGFIMSSPRVGVPAQRPVHREQVAAPRVIQRSMKFNHVTRPAVWTSDVAQQRRQTNNSRLLRTLEDREVSRVIDEWYASDVMSVESRLLDLRYSDAEAERLANDLRRGVRLVTLATADRKRVEVFRTKLGEACMDRLATLDDASLEATLEAHAFNEGQRARLRSVLRSEPQPEEEEGEGGNLS